MENIENLNGIQQYFEIHGSGEPLVLLHGFTGSSSTWGEISQELSKDYQLIIPDMRGHGRSTNDSSGYTFRQVALDIFALLDKLNITKFKCIGCSGGGNALLHMATQQPDRVDSMILISSTSHYPEQARSIMAKATVDTFNEEQWQSLRKLHVQGDAQILKLFEYIKAFATDFNDMNFTSNDLSAISASTLIVQGDRDFIYPVEISVDMYKAIPNSSLWVIPNAGHGPIMDENMDRFIDIAKKFLKN